MKPDELVSGKTYFVWGYLHPKYPIPKIRSMVYLGKNLHSEREDPDKDEYIFQEPQYYYLEDMRRSLTKEEFEELYDPEYSGKLIIPEDALQTVSDVDELISWLSSLKDNRFADEIF